MLLHPMCKIEQRKCLLFRARVQSFENAANEGLQLRDGNHARAMNAHLLGDADVPLLAMLRLGKWKNTPPMPILSRTSVQIPLNSQQEFLVVMLVPFCCDINYRVLAGARRERAYTLHRQSWSYHSSSNGSSPEPKYIGFYASSPTSSISTTSYTDSAVK